MQDKLTFIFGVLLVIFHAFFLGKHPHDLFYKWHSIIMALILFGKWRNLKSTNNHYYFTDFCYFSNMILIVFLNYFPKNEILFIVVFLFSNGNLAVSVGLYKN